MSAARLWLEKVAGGVADREALEGLVRLVRKVGEFRGKRAMVTYLSRKKRRERTRRSRIRRRGR